MRTNERTTLVGEKCVLVPYLKRHVEHYNKWMQSPELLEMTASEPLTIEEEYEMQRSWREDENKCTFIILARDSPEQVITRENALEQKMVGDVNLFYNDHDDPCSAEIEIMIAEPSYRRKGMGLEALRMMMTYAQQSLKTTRITSKISTENQGSIQLFLTQLGFTQISYSEIFGEVTLERVLGPAIDAKEGGLATSSTATTCLSSSCQVHRAINLGTSPADHTEREGEAQGQGEEKSREQRQEDPKRDCDAGTNNTSTFTRFETIELDPKDLDF